MNIDDKIKSELKTESNKLDKLLAQEPGIFGMLHGAYKGSLGGWMILVGIVTFIVTVVMLWCGYQFFFIEGTIETKLHWGIGLLLAAMMQVALKMWSFMEMNRQSMLRDIKRIELQVERLVNKLDSK